MRTINTLILRLMTDTDQPYALRGVLRTVIDHQEYAFTDEKSLLALLREIGDAHHRSQGQPEGEGSDLEGSTLS